MTVESPLRTEELPHDNQAKAALKRNFRIAWLVGGIFLIFLLWAWFATLDEVSSGEGRVVPTTSEQTLQSLNGGILAKLFVKQDDVVEAGQILAQLDPTRSESDVQETEARYRAAIARADRLEAETGQQPLKFSSELENFAELKATESRLYATRRASLAESLALIDRSIALVKRETDVAQSLLDVGAASNVEVIRLMRQQSELELKKSEIQSEYMVRAREELSKTREEINSLLPVVTGRNFSLDNMTLRSPVKGIVKSIATSTIGGVVAPGGTLMEIIPLDDQLLIEARISPRDIAFIHPGQRATVKVTAYDSAIYGTLAGTVKTISPDTIQDKNKPEIYYYRVYVRTSASYLENANKRKFFIFPGMMATVDIHTGQKTVFDYLVKPFNKAREAMRER